MKRLFTSLAVGAMPAVSPAFAEATPERPEVTERRRLAPEAVYKVSPPLGDYTDRVLSGEVWPYATLSPRDRSLVAVAVLIAMGQA